MQPDLSTSQPIGPRFTKLALFANVFCPLSAALVLLELIFKWDIIDIVTPFVEPLLAAVIWLLFCGSALLAFFVLVCASGVKPQQRLFPMAITIISLVLALTVDFTKLVLDVDFKYNLSAREQCVKELLSLPQTSQEMVTLPPGFLHLSRGGGEVEVTGAPGHRKILFYTYRGILDNFSGFLYADMAESLKQSDYKSISPLAGHWFYIANW